MAEQVQPEPSTDPFDELDAQLRQDIDQLLDQNCLSEGFTFGGHTFVIKTLNSSESNAAALAMRGMQNTLRETHAYMQSVVGLALVSFDGDAEFHIRVGDLNTHAAKRFEWAGQLDDMIVSFVFRRYNALDQRRIAARQAVTNLPTPGQTPSTLWPDILTEQDTFSVGTPTESPYSPR
jgi:hypothetical protein